MTKGKRAKNWKYAGKTGKYRGLCKNCREPLSSRWEEVIGSCSRCIDMTDQWIRSKYRCYPDYDRAYQDIGYEYGLNMALVRVIPMKSQPRHRLLGKLFRN